VKAITKKEGVAVVNREECIGCGLCATGCSNDAARIQRKPEEIMHPPEDFATWEKERIIFCARVDYSARAKREKKYKAKYGFKTKNKREIRLKI
jgi:Fe-S-cluster-containing hydrogenase component 2